MKHFSMKVSGRVQGVYFRASTADKARQLGLNGFVKNDHDGSVYIEVEGEETALYQMAEWAKVGPPKAVVDDCIITEGDVKDYSGFQILR
jgi:acylphosphatase